MILLAEDEILNKMLLESYMEKLGYDYISVENGEDAVIACHETKFQLIILDNSMPILDGIEAIEQIQQVGNKNAETPIILLSGTSSHNLTDLVKNVSIQLIMKKPFTLTDIQNCIEEFYKE